MSDAGAVSDGIQGVEDRAHRAKHLRDVLRARADVLKLRVLLPQELDELGQVRIFRVWDLGRVARGDQVAVEGGVDAVDAARGTAGADQRFGVADRALAARSWRGSPVLASRASSRNPARTSRARPSGSWPGPRRSRLRGYGETLRESSRGGTGRRRCRGHSSRDRTPGASGTRSRPGIRPRPRCSRLRPCRSQAA